VLAVPGLQREQRTVLHGKLSVLCVWQGSKGGSMGRNSALWMVWMCDHHTRRNILFLV
jgi:hypothetical protein